MRSFNIVLILVVLIGNLNARTHTSITAGSWTAGSTWNTGRIPSNNDEIIIDHEVSYSGDLSIQANTDVTINSGGALKVTGNLTLKGNGALDTKGEISAVDFKVQGNATYASDGGAVNLSGELGISGGLSFTSAKTDYTASSVTRTGGSNIIFTAGRMTVANQFDARGGGSICFDGTVVSVGTTMDLRGSVTIYVGGRGSLSIPTVAISGAAAIMGKDMGGWFNCETMTISSGKVACVDGGCNFDSDNYEDMPGALDLAGSAALPVELLYFKAKRNLDEMLIVNWATAVEVNNDYFSIEMSVDGKTWKSIGEVKGAGNSDVTIEYDWSSEKVEANGSIYIRLKQTDFDGSFTYSEIESVTMNKKETKLEVNIYPNPATEYVVIEGIAADATPQITLINMQGQQINITSIDQGSNTRVNIPSQLPAGSYGLLIQAGDHVQTERIMIQK